jgi:hypothetical protein
MEQQRDELAARIERGIAMAAGAARRVEALHHEAEGCWLQGKSLDDHAREIAVRDFEVRVLEASCPRWRQELVNIETEIDRFHKKHGV